MTKSKLTLLSFSVIIIICGSCMHVMWKTYSAYPVIDDVSYCVDKLFRYRHLHVHKVKTFQKSSNRLPSSLSMQFVYRTKELLSKQPSQSLSEKLLYIEAWGYSGNDMDATVECLVTCGRVCEVSVAIGENRELFDASLFVNMVDKLACQDESR